MDSMVPNLINYAIPAFFLLIFGEIIAGLVMRRKIYRLGDSISDLSSGIVSQIVGIFTKVLGLFFYVFIYEKFRFLELPATAWYTWVLALVGQDFFYYWAHRLSHEINLLWAAHVVHHHSEEYNLTVALRQSAFQGLFTQFVYFPLAILGVPPLHFAVAGQISLIYQFWIHTEVVGKMGWFEYIFNTPSHHRVHHAINPQYIDKNHGGTLIIWDKLFGTFAKEEEPCVYGTVTPLKSYNVIWANLHYFVEIFRLMRKADKFTDKIKVWFAMPGWQPASGGKPAYHKPVPQVSRQTFVKYDPQMSPFLKVYTTTWFTILALLTFAFLLFWAKLASWQMWASGSYLIFSLLVLGGLTEGKKWATSLELLRLLSLSVLSCILLMPHFPQWLFLPIVINVVSAYLILKYPAHKQVILKVI